MTQPANHPKIDVKRRRLLQTGSMVLLLGAREIAWGASIVSVRIWPADEYSRVTIESDAKLGATPFMIDSPHRLFVDVKGLQLNTALDNLTAKVRTDDPNIAGIRVAQNSAGVVRLVIDLKQAIKPQVFSLAPVAAYQHRLVFDLYPTVGPDPLAQLIAAHTQPRTPSTSPSSVVVTGGSLPPPDEVAESPDALGDLIARRIEQAAGNQPQPTPPQVARAPTSPAPTTKKPAPSKATKPQHAPANDANRLIVVAIDPGHGGEDPGAIGPGGTREKDVVLRVAMKLRDQINKSRAGNNPMRAFLTRDSDFFVPLATRVQKARRVNADLFVSIHADSFPRAAASGASVYALSERGASSTAASWLAKKENEADLVGGINTDGDAHVKRAILDMSTTAQIRDSVKLGGALLGPIGNVGKLHKGAVERANFAVLRNPDVPSVLVETGFISNPQEERKLASAAYQQQLANALARGIVKYFAANPPLARNRQV